MATNSPGPTRRPSPSSTARAPKRLVRPSTRSIGRFYGGDRCSLWLQCLPASDRSPSLNTPSVTIDTIRAAQARLAGHVENTPCLHSRTLSEITGAEVYLKFENLQFTASFKERGALNKLSTLTPEQKARGVIAVSAGNHAQGVAYHAQRLGIPAVIVMPRFTPMVKIERTRGFGAEVVLSGDTFDDSKAEAARLAADARADDGASVRRRRT